MEIPEQKLVTVAEDDLKLLISTLITARLVVQMWKAKGDIELVLDQLDNLVHKSHSILENLSTVNPSIVRKGD